MRTDEDVKHLAETLRELNLVEEARCIEVCRGMWWMRIGRSNIKALAFFVSASDESKISALVEASLWKLISCVCRELNLIVKPWAQQPFNMQPFNDELGPEDQKESARQNSVAGLCEDPYHLSSLDGAQTFLYFLTDGVGVDPPLHHPNGNTSTMSEQSLLQETELQSQRYPGKKDTQCLKFYVSVAQHALSSIPNRAGASSGFTPRKGRQDFDFDCATDWVAAIAADSAIDEQLQKIRTAAKQLSTMVSFGIAPMR